MLFLLFELGPDRYAFDVRQITQIIPLVALKTIPRAPDGIAGLLNYRGMAVPVVDLSQLAVGRPCARRLSTRIVLVHCLDQTGHSHLLGLIVERATRTAHYDPAAFVPSGVPNADAPYLGPVAVDDGSLLQWVDARKMLPASLSALLFTAPMDGPWPLPR
jgi:chemotaxis-related protein WspB